MNKSKIKIGLGGSCHWCTEAIFQSLCGVLSVEQGWISAEEAETLSEAVLITFTPEEISLATLIEIHLYTHSCTAQHSMRDKYRSAIYCFNTNQEKQSLEILGKLQSQFEAKIITQVLSFKEFKLNKEEQLNYYYTDTERPFCTNVILPKLKILLKQFNESVNTKKLKLIPEHETSEA